MNQSQYERLFKDIIKIKHRMNIDFEKIETRLIHLKEGSALAYEDLEIIGDDSCWPFSEYWMWPTREQIENQLPQTLGWFKNLPIKEEEIIKGLDVILKNIALVSIMLRFVHPAYYAIYSRPPLKILRVERGINDIAEYINYLQVMRTLKRSFGVTRTADVDVIVWATAFAKGEYLSRLKRVLAERLPEILTPGEIIQHLDHNPLKVADLYLKKNDHETAGFWTSIAFEKLLNLECYSCPNWNLSDKANEIKYKVKFLSQTPKYKGMALFLDNLRKLRNAAVHSTEKFTKDDARRFFEGTVRFQSLAKYSN
jgi:hypothetical protein